jgi:hypothetical protein
MPQGGDFAGATPSYRAQDPGCRKAGGSCHDVGMGVESGGVRGHARDCQERGSCLFQLNEHRVTTPGTSLGRPAAGGPGHDLGPAG